MAKNQQSIMSASHAAPYIPNGRANATPAANGIPLLKKKAYRRIFQHIRKKQGNQIDFVSLNGESQTYKRLVTNLSEINRVSGGGLVPGSVILVGGDPGIGKSTLLLQICAGMANKLQDNSCFYISGEEAIDQVRIRAKRLGLADAPVRLASTTSVKDIIATLEKKIRRLSLSIQSRLCILTKSNQHRGVSPKFGQPLMN